MTSPFVLFRVAAGPRIGHGHLRRVETLAHALARPAFVSMRGSGAPTALRVVPDGSPGATLDASKPSVLVIDDPAAAMSAPWSRAARDREVPVVSLHDLGLARIPSTLAVDGSVASPAKGWVSPQVSRGLPYAVIRAPRANRRGPRVRRVLVSLGGGPRRALVAAIVSEIARRWSSLEILAAQPVRRVLRGDRVGRCRQVAAPDGLGPWLARVDVAVLAGGLSLYEAIAAGVPAVAVPVVPAQRATVRGFAARELAIDAGSGDGVRVTTIARRVADGLAAAIADDAWRQRVRRDGPCIIDGRGAARVADAIIAVAEAARA